MCSYYLQTTSSHRYGNKVPISEYLILKLFGTLVWHKSSGACMNYITKLKLRYYSSEDRFV